MKRSMFTVTENRPLTARVFRLRLRGDCSGITGPGQFVQISLPGLFLRRPFSVGDCRGDEITLHCETVGRGTEQMRALAEGAELDVLSGLGNGFDLSRAGDSPLLVGGGTGVSPLLGLARALTERGIRPRVVLGFETRDDVFLADELEGLGLSPELTTADGSFGVCGLVTDAIDFPHSYFYACGPEAMLRAVAKKSPAGGQMSFDARMGCGFGACMGCTMLTKNGPRRVCRDGPVFEKEELLWED